MHAGKLHARLHWITEEFDSGQIIQNLAELERTLDTSVKSPSEKNTQAFRQTYEKMGQTLQSAQINVTTPTGRMILDKIGATKYTGQGLWEKLSAIISQNSVAPANALEQLGNLQRGVRGFHDSVQTLHDKLHELNIEHEELPNKLARIGVVIPEGLVESKLEGLATELHEFDDVFKTFQRIAGQKPVSLAISSIGPGGFQLFLDAGPVVGAITARAVEEIAAMYENLQEVRKLREGLAKQNVPAERIEALQADEKQLVEKGLDELTKSLLAEYYSSTDKSRGDLKVLLARDLRFLADRIDRGVVVEAEMAGPTASAKAARKKLIQNINDRGRALGRLQRESEPIFGLGEEEFAEE